MGILAMMMPIPNTGGAPFFVAAAMMMGTGSMAAAAGWGLHLFTGIIVGAIFGTLVAGVSSLRPKTAARATGLGVAAGVAVWVVLFMPMMIMLMPALTGMTLLIGGSFVAHVVFGLVLGGATSLATPKANAGFKCEACGQTFETKQALMEHGKVHMPQAASPETQHVHQLFKCDACGMAFHSQAELAEHAKKMHPMPAR
jgi:uncharacterized C2H2 Zn-finger protein